MSQLWKLRNFLNEDCYYIKKRWNWIVCDIFYGFSISLESSGQKKIILKKTIIVSNKTGWLIDHYSIRKIYSIANNVFDWKQQIENVLKEKIPESSVWPIFDELRLGLQRIVARHYYSTLAKERKNVKKWLFWQYDS